MISAELIHPKQDLKLNTTSPVIRAKRDFKYECISYKNELQLLSQNQEPWTNLIQKKIVPKKSKLRTHHLCPKPSDKTHLHQDPITRGEGYTKP